MLTRQAGGAQALRLSRDGLQDAASRGLPADRLRRAAALTAVIADGQVLTVYRHTNSRQSLRRSRIVQR